MGPYCSPKVRAFSSAATASCTANTVSSNVAASTQLAKIQQRRQNNCLGGDYSQTWGGSTDTGADRISSKAAASSSSKYCREAVSRSRRYVDNIATSLAASEALLSASCTLMNSLVKQLNLKSASANLEICLWTACGQTRQMVCLMNVEQPCRL
jgi:hypothetical protein